MTRNLKALSKELDIPILLLSQLKRPMPGEKAPKPRLEDLRESGDIEQDADIVIFTHRPEMSERDESTGRLWFNRGMFVVAKNRRGARDVEIPYAHDQFCKIFVDDGEDDPAWGCGDVLAYEKFADKYRGGINGGSRFDSLK
jgi:replicative DNA helicase